jgi:hypothetical protein
VRGPVRTCPPVNWSLCAGTCEDLPTCELEFVCAGTCEDLPTCELEFVCGDL